MRAEPASLAAAARCGARTRSGAPCRSPAVGGVGRCRMHGGKGSGAPRGNRNAWRHGVRSAWYRDTARFIRASNPAAMRRLLASVGLAKPPRSPATEQKSEKRTNNPMQRSEAARGPVLAPPSGRVVRAPSCPPDGPDAASAASGDRRAGLWDRGYGRYRPPHRQPWPPPRSRRP